MNRRNFLKLIAAGATVVAGELWIPGQKLISIPSGKVFTDSAFSLDAYGNITVNGGTNATHTVLELHRWLMDLADRTDNDYLDITSPTPSMRVTDNIIELQKGYNVVNPEYLCGGSLKNGNGEQWANITTVGQVADDSYLSINGKRALRPGHLDQCIKYDEHNPQIMIVSSRPGYNRFGWKKPLEYGRNIGAIAEMDKI